MAVPVLHVMLSWGAPSQTFVRDLVLRVPGYEPVVVCEDVEGDAPVGTPLSTVGGVLRRLPSPVAGKAAIAMATMVGLRHRVALVHAHFGHEILLARRTAGVLRRPLVVALHGRDLLVELEGRHLEAVRRADAVVVPSPFLADAAVARGLAPERIVVIPSGVDIDAIPFTERRLGPDQVPLVLFVGRFVEKKGVLDAAAAVVEVAKRHPLRARFVGTGPLETDLRRALLPMGSDAEVVDGTDRANVLQGFADAHVLISPSRTAADGDAETLLVVNLEAQAAGIPVVTTHHGGIPYAVDPASAVVVPEAELPALVKGLEAVVTDPDRWPAMGRAGRDMVSKRFTMTQTLTATARLYDRVRAGAAAAGSGERAPNPSSC